MQDLIDDPLAALRDIHLPEEPSWWPPATGWWWLMLALILFAILIGLLFRFLYLRRYRLRRRALQTLRQLRTRHQHGESQQPICAELSNLLKSTAVRQFPDDAVAGLTGKAWLDFLNRSGHSKDFTRGCGHSLISAPYQPAPQIDLDALLDLSEQWLLQNT